MMIHIESVAEVCHEANRVLQKMADDPMVSPHWDDAPDWQRTSAMEGVANAVKGRTPAELHEDWCHHKRADGWVYGRVKDPQAKTHPCLVPYDDLPRAERMKDRLFLAIVATLVGGV
jgi:hypothetical protein